MNSIPFKFFRYNFSPLFIFVLFLFYHYHYILLLLLCGNPRFFILTSQLLYACSFHERLFGLTQDAFGFRYELAAQFNFGVVINIFICHFSIAFYLKNKKSENVKTRYQLAWIKICFLFTVIYWRKQLML